MKKAYFIKLFSEPTLELLEITVNKWFETRAKVPEFELISSTLVLSPLAAYKTMLVVYKGASNSRR